MIHQPKVMLQKRINNIYIYIYIYMERERERVITFCGREIENKMRKRSIKKIKYSHKSNTKLFKP